MFARSFVCFAQFNWQAIQKIIWTHVGAKKERTQNCSNFHANRHNLHVKMFEVRLGNGFAEMRFNFLFLLLRDIVIELSENIRLIIEPSSLQLPVERQLFYHHFYFFSVVWCHFFVYLMCEQQQKNNYFETFSLNGGASQRYELKKISRERKKT